MDPLGNLCAGSRLSNEKTSQRVYALLAANYLKNRAAWGFISVSGERFRALQRHYAARGTSRLRCK